MNKIWNFLNPILREWKNRLQNRKAKKELLTEKYYMASQWKLMWHKFKRHTLARISLVVLGILYFTAIFAEFIAIQGNESFDRNYVNCPPTRIHIYDPATSYLGLFVYKTVSHRDPETYLKQYQEHKSTIYPIRFFCKGEAYRIWGLFKGNRHLYGVDEGGVIFLLGADNMGRDLLSRIINGSRISLSIGFIGVIISLVLGVTIGGISGFFGGIVDNVIQRIIEVIRSFPTIPLWMALSAAIPLNIPDLQVYFLITIILSFIGWTSIARRVRSKFISLREEDYVMAAKLVGCSNARIISTHLVPGFLSYIIVELTLAVPQMILAETSLSFLGLGIKGHITSWGVLLQEAQQVQNVALHPWLLWPLLFVVITVLAFNFLGDGLRDAADPYKN